MTHLLLLMTSSEFSSQSDQTSTESLVKSCEVAFRKQEKSLKKEKKKRKLKNETLGNFDDLSIRYAHRRSRTTRVSRS